MRFGQAISLVTMMLLSRSTAFCRQLSSSSAASSRVIRHLSSSSSITSGATELIRQDAETQMSKLTEYYSSVESFSTPTMWQTRKEASEFVQEHIDTVLFDCDGVLYRTSDVCPGASDCIQGLMDSGKKVLFVTNNAGVNRRELRDKISKLLGIPELSVEQMVSSSYSCAQYLQHQLPANSRIHVIGSSGLCEEIANTSGFQVTGGPSDESPSMTRQELEEYQFPEHPIDAIAVGHDTQFSFRKLSIANNLLLLNKQALLVATNEDSFDLVGTDHRHIPGNGCTVKALEHCSRRSAINVGKPSSVLWELLVDQHGLDPAKCLFVGDRLDTDVKFGNDHGMKSLLVMTGVTTAETMMELAQGTPEEPLPRFVVPYIGMLV